MMFITMLILAVISAIVFLVVRVKKAGLAGFYTKTIASVFFILLAIFSYFEVVKGKILIPKVYTAYSMFIITGLIFGMLGDVFLDLKVAYTKDNDIHLPAGMISFSIGHIFYLIALMVYSGSVILEATNGKVDVSLGFHYGPLIAAIVVGAGAIILAPFMKLDIGKFKIPAATYGILLTYTAVQSLYSLIVASQAGTLNNGLLVMTIGGISFLISDLILSQIYFAKEKNMDTPIMVLACHITYYIAQILIALSIFFIY